MEINGNPFPYEGDVFEGRDRPARPVRAGANGRRSNHDTRIGMFGVFPSVTPEHLNPDDYMTELHRYNQLNRQLLSMRGKPIHLHLEGEDVLDIEKNDVMLEALATSLQIHMQVPYDEIVPTYNAGLWSSMLVLAGDRQFAAGAGQVLLAGVAHRHLQAGGGYAQPAGNRGSHHPARASRQALHRFLARPVRRQFLLQPDPARSARRDPPEDLHHLQLHNGTIWRWVRPIIARNGDGGYHLRLELRVAPSGPTLVDTLANLVFYVGLTEGLKQSATT